MKLPWPPSGWILRRTLGRVRDPSAARERILEVTIWALESTAEVGFTVDQIAEAAHVGKQSIYQYFGDRDGLIVAAQAERYRRSILTGSTALMDGLIDCVTLEEYVHLLLSVAMTILRTGGERRRFRIQALGSAVTRPNLQAEIGEAHRASVATLTKVFAFGQRRDWVSTTYSASTLSAFWFDVVTGHHVSESYIDEAEHESINWATIDAVSFMLFGATFPELRTEIDRALESWDGDSGATPDQPS